MKGYEVASRTTLPGRLPVIIRVDGKAFHTYTRGCKRPFDDRLSDVMVSTATKLCDEIQGAQLAYTQSDEISVLVHGYKKFKSQTWFDNQVQKMASVAAGIASATFTAQSWRIWRADDVHRDAGVTTLTTHIKPAYFDARVFVVPEADVCNYFLWRQQDATRNSVQMLALALFSHKQCYSKNVIELKAMCEQIGSSWEKLPIRYQRGLCIRKGVMDDNIPLFNQDRDYINELLKLEEK